jgi:hypothetical protein
LVLYGDRWEKSFRPESIKSLNTLEVAVMAKQRTAAATKATSAPAGLAESGPSEARNPTDSSSIAALAYLLWHARGCPDGSPETDWFQAEETIYSQSVAPKSLSTRQLLLTRQVSA